MEVLVGNCIGDLVKQEMFRAPHFQLEYKIFSKQCTVGFAYKYLPLQISLNLNYWAGRFWVYCCGSVKVSLLPIWKKMHLHEPQVFASVL